MIASFTSLTRLAEEDDAARAVLADHLRLMRANEAGLPDPEGRRVYAILGPVPLPVSLGGGASVSFQWTTFSRVDGTLLAGLDPLDPEVLQSPGALKMLLKQLSRVKEWPQSVLTLGDFPGAESPLVRIHSSCATGDIFGSQRCECGPQLRGAMEQVARAGVGALIYMADHEGRGIGLFAKAAAYLLQDQGFDTYEANRLLGYEDDDRDFSDAGFILNHLRGEGRGVRLLSNNPEKGRSLNQVGIPVDQMIPLVTGVTSKNLRYLKAKRLYGHILPEDLLGQGARRKP